MRVCLYPYRIALWNTKALQLETDQQHYLYHIQAIRPEQVADPTEWETEMTKQHFYYLKEQTEKGSVADFSEWPWGYQSYYATKCNAFWDRDV